MTNPSDAVYSELVRLAEEHNGFLNPEIVVETASDPANPLHSRFEWDDTLAAYEHRLFQARSLIRVCVNVVAPQTHTEDRVFVSLQNDRGQQGYRFLVDVLNDDDLRAQLLEQARADMDRFLTKYNRLSELAEVLSVMKKAQQKKPKKGKEKALVTA